jgi:autotransporter-associated beta strand protein
MQTTTGGNRYNLESQSGLLTISGALNNSLDGRYWQLLGSGDGVVSGVIGGGSSPSTTYLIKSGSGTWTLAATNLYTAPTTINAGTLRVTGILANTAVTNDGGTLAGNGVINGPVAIVSGTLEPGISTALNETLTIRNDLVLGDTARFQIGKSGATPVCDRVIGVTNITYSGTLIVTNVTGATWANGDSFNLFSASGTKSGNFTNIVLQPAVAGVTPSFDPATGNLTLAVTAPPVLNVGRSSGSLQFSWTGSYKLQSQTNTLNQGLGTNWFDYPGGTNSPVTVPVDAAKPAVFFRLSQ